MLNYTRVLALLAPLSYLLAILWFMLTQQQMYHDGPHLRFALMSLGLWYFSQFVTNQTLQSVIFAIILIVLFRLFASVWYGYSMDDRVIGTLNLLFFIAYVICLVQLWQVKTARSKLE